MMFDNSEKKYHPVRSRVQKSTAAVKIKFLRQLSISFRRRAPSFEVSVQHDPIRLALYLHQYII